MGDFVADIMRARYPGVEAALTNSGGLRADLVVSPPSSAGEQPGEITWGEVFAVLPFGNRTVILTLTGAQLEQAFLNGFSPSCNPAIATGRFPQISGLKATYTCNGTTPVVTSMSKVPDEPGGTPTPIGPADTIRLVTNDFMFTGGDGYTVLASGTDVLQPGDGLLEIVVDYIRADIAGQSADSDHHLHRADLPHRRAVGTRFAWLVSARPARQTRGRVATHGCSARRAGRRWTARSRAGRAHGTARCRSTRRPRRSSPAR